MSVNRNDARRARRRRFLLASAAVCTLASQCVFCCVGLAAGSEGERLVVVLYPEANDGAPGTTLSDRGIRSVFAGDTRENVKVHNEYLDVSRFPDPGYQTELAGFLRRKYAGRKVDLVLAGLSSALDFAVSHRREMFGDAPIIFLCVDESEVRSRKLDADVIGAPLKVDLEDTLDLALALHPGTRQAYIVVGRSKYDASWEAAARRAFHDAEQRVTINYLSGLSMSDLLTQVKNLPPHSVIYYFHVFEDGNGAVHMPADVLSLLSAAANAPIYGHANSYIGRGIVGGRVYSFEEEGRRAARLGLRVLSGERPDQIGIQEAGDNAYVFDGRQLKRYGIDESNLPAGSVVRFQAPSMWDLYKWQIAGAALLCLFQSLLIIGLIVQRLRSRRAEQRFRQAIDAVPNGMLMVGQDGQVVLVNSQIERIFGYRRDELVGHSVDVLLPARCREDNAVLRRAFFNGPQSRPMGAGSDLYGLRKDGSEVPIEVRLNPLNTEAGRFVLASVIDTSEIRRAQSEVHESHRQMQELAGRLFGAQETERRKIARELHDDFGQSLALLSVEIDLLRRRPVEPTTQSDPRVESMAVQVKQLSSSIHDLSHQLHPIKLEQLGLVAAVGSLCKELSRAHDLNIDFRHKSVPEKVSHTAAVCLYRVVQEALRNVIKHSGTRSARVELRGEADTICLRVDDKGAGFDPASLTGAGLGLVSMRERLRAVHGQIAITSQPSHGTQIDVQIPTQANTPLIQELVTEAEEQSVSQLEAIR